MSEENETPNTDKGAESGQDTAKMNSSKRAQGGSEFLDELDKELTSDKNYIRSCLKAKEHQASYDVHADTIEAAIKKQGITELTDAQAKEVAEVYAKNHIGEGEKASEAALNAALKKIEDIGKSAKELAELLPKQKEAAGKLYDGLSEELKKKAGNKDTFIDAAVKEMGDKTAFTKEAESGIKKAIADGGEKLHENIGKAVNEGMAEKISFWTRRFVTPVSGNIGKTFSDAWNNEAKGLAFGKGALVGVGGYTVARGFSNLGKQDEEGQTHNGTAALEIAGGAAATLAGLCLKREGLRV